jgi:hypothetical protein
MSKERPVHLLHFQRPGAAKAISGYHEPRRSIARSFPPLALVNRWNGTLSRARGIPPIIPARFAHPPLAIASLGMNSQQSGISIPTHGYP